MKKSRGQNISPLDFIGRGDTSAKDYPGCLSGQESRAWDLRYGGRVGWWSLRRRSLLAYNRKKGPAPGLAAPLVAGKGCQEASLTFTLKVQPVRNLCRVSIRGLATLKLMESGIWGTLSKALTKSIRAAYEMWPSHHCPLQLTYNGCRIYQEGNHNGNGIKCLSTGAGAKPRSE